MGSLSTAATAVCSLVSVSDPRRTAEHALGEFRTHRQPATQIDSRSQRPLSHWACRAGRSGVAGPLVPHGLEPSPRWWCRRSRPHASRGRRRRPLTPGWRAGRARRRGRRRRLAGAAAPDPRARGAVHSVTLRSARKGRFAGRIRAVLRRFDTREEDLVPSRCHRCQSTLSGTGDDNFKGRGS